MSRFQKIYPYFSKEYDSKERFCSYWHQINEVISLQPVKVLEIGIGNQFVAQYLTSRGLKIITFDVEKKLGPDVVGSVLEVPFEGATFEVILCCEVLEHLPYPKFVPALKEIWRVSKPYSIISVPDVTTVYRFNIEVPRFGEIKKLISHPFPKSSVHHFDGEHHWLIGKTDYPLKRIVADINKSGFEILKTYRVFECYYHRFFLLRKQQVTT
jgi:predicted SAM-dependent methyltransferase